MEKNPVDVKLLLKSFKFEPSKMHVKGLFCYLPNSSVLYEYKKTDQFNSDLADDIFTFTRVPIVGNIQRVITGNSNTFVLTDQGLFGRGSNYYGGLGLGHTNKVDTFQLIPHIVGNIQQVFNNGFNTFILTDHGLFTCGENTDGALGLGHTNDVHTFVRVPNIEGNIQQVISNQVRTFVLTNYGLFACGRNDYGHLGLGHPYNFSEERPAFVYTDFVRVPNIEGNIQQVITDYRSTFVLTDQGLFACGYNGNGQLGIGHTNDVSTFQRVPNIIGNIQQVFDGGNNTIVLTDQGLFACGHNRYGYSGQTHTDNVPTFTLIPNIKGNIRQVITNYYNTFVLTDHELFACGNNYYGNLGIGHTHNKKVSGLVRIPNIEGNIQQIIANERWTFVFSDQGLFACGQNHNGNLLLGHDKDVSTFHRVPNIEGKIQKIYGLYFEGLNFIQTEEEIYSPDRDNMLYEPIDLSMLLSAPIKQQSKQEEVKIMSVNKVKAQVKIPPTNLCPLSHQIMLDPVIAGDGFTYEREEIQKALSLKLVSPMTNEVLDDARLLPNRAIRSAIAELLTQHPELWEDGNVHGETVYFSTELQNQAITALQTGTLVSLKQCLARDPRLLTHSTLITHNFLELACQLGSLETLSIVLNAMKQTSWEKILKQTSAEKLLQLCSQHLGPEAAKLLGDNLGWTVDRYQEQAYKAIEQGDKQLLLTCLMAGVSVNTVDAKGKSLINYAAECRQIPIVIYLLKAGAKVKLKNNQNPTSGQEVRAFEYDSTAQAIETEQFKAKLQLLNLNLDSLQTPVTSSVQVSQPQEQVAQLVKTVQQLEAEVAYLKEQLKANASNGTPLLGDQLPTFSSTSGNDNNNYPRKFFFQNQLLSEKGSSEEDTDSEESYYSPALSQNSSEES